MYDYSRLRGRIIEICGSQREFARRMGKSEETISSKMLQKKAFSQLEIEKAMEILRIKPSEMHLYFFCRKKVQFA